MLLETLAQPNTLIGIADDDPDIILAVSGLVRSAGYEVECFHLAAARLLRSNFEDFLCIISDFDSALHERHGISQGALRS